MPMRASPARPSRRRQTCLYNLPMSLSDLSGYLSDFEPPPTAGLLDANGWLREPAVCLASVSLRLLAAGGRRPEGIDAALQRLMATQPWPTFSVELSSGTSLHVVWRNYEGESGVDLLLAAGDGVHSLSSFEGHSSWPGLSWAECSQIASRVSTLTPAEALIVLFPFVGGELGPTGVEVLTGALSRQGVSPDRSFIEQLISAADARDQFAQPGPAWADRDGATTFLGRNSSRGPASPADFRRLVDRCLSGKTP